jgi:hypothetical protein
MPKLKNIYKLHPFSIYTTKSSVSDFDTETEEMEMHREVKQKRSCNVNR